MAQYLALTYTADVDWFAPPQAAELAEYRQFAKENERRILATLVRTVGNLQVAEDAVQDAVVTALREWPRAGVPDQPRAWLTVTARRRAIDILRREAARAGKEREGADLMELSKPDLPPE